jgi:hypothetical protein
VSVTDQELTAIGDANGQAVLSITPYRRQVWTVQQVSIEAATAPPEATAAVYKGDFQVTPLVAQSDAASGDPPVVLRPGQVLSVRWSNLNTGDQVRAIFFYDDGT